MRTMTEAPLPLAQRVDEESFLQAYLAGRDSSCPGCGYNVRDLAGSRCPECGAELILSLRLAEPRQGLLIAGLIGLASGAGFSGLLLIYAAIMLLRDQFGGPPSEFYVTIVIGLLVHGAALWIWLANWRRMRRLPASHRMLLVVFAWVLPMVYIVIFSFTIR